MDVFAHIRDRLGETFANRFGREEIARHTRDGLRDYARMTECFFRQQEIAAFDGLLRLPEEALRPTEVRNPEGENLTFTSWRNCFAQWGPTWFRKRIQCTIREVTYFVTDFDDFGYVRLVPKPPDETMFSVVFLTETGETDFRIIDAVAEYVLALLLLRDGDNAAMTHYQTFLRMAGPVGNSTRLPGSVRGGVWF